MEGDHIMRYRVVRTPIAALAIASLCLVAAACGQAPAAPASGPIARTLSASGDAAAGKLVFENAGGCAACHATTTEQLVGPGLAGVMDQAGPTHATSVSYAGRLPNGQPRTEEQLAAWIRSGGSGEIGYMTGRELDDAAMADLLAYLHTLTR
jgi:cytochrome c